MAPHDYRRLLLAQRDSRPSHVPAGPAAEPSRTLGAGDAPMKPPGPRTASPAEQAEPGEPPSVRAFC